MTAQKCSFPFQYNSNNYTTCTNTDQTYNWCSPSPEFNGQYLPCDLKSKLEKLRNIYKKINVFFKIFIGSVNKTCSNASVDENSFNFNSSFSISNNMVFTSAQMPAIISVSPSDITYQSIITILGTIFIYLYYFKINKSI